MNNAINSLFHRLLHLYPVSIVKAHFNVKGNFDDIITDVLKNHSHASINKFAHDNINYTRQHVFVYTIKPMYKGTPLDLKGFPLTVKDSQINNGVLTIHCLPKVEFQVLTVKPYLETEIHLFQPVKIQLTKHHLIIQITTLEKNLSHFFPGNQKVVDTTRSETLEQWLKRIVAFFVKRNFAITLCDLHKGIKELWAKKEIDPKYAKSKTSKSTWTEAMDENYTVAEAFPEKYKEMVKNPLLKMLFKYKGKDGKFPDHFHSDPLNGEIVFSAYSDNLMQVENVINEILAHN